MRPGIARPRPTLGTLGDLIPPRFGLGIFTPVGSLGTLGFGALILFRPEARPPNPRAPKSVPKGLFFDCAFFASST